MLLELSQGSSIFSLNLLLTSGSRRGVQGEEGVHSRVLLPTPPLGAAVQSQQ